MSLIALISSALAETANRLRAVLVAFSAWRQSRADFQSLCEMDDKMLADLGLTRGDLRDATAVGLLEDPTLIVATRAGARRPRRFMAQPKSVAHPTAAKTASLSASGL
ncbi:MAG: DUF1127 domain-containing protein [Alphaproteobacteria bacterium]